MAVDGIGTHLRDSINSGLTRWRLTVYMNAIVKRSRKAPVSKHMRDGTAKLSRETKFSGANGDVGK